MRTDQAMSKPQDEDNSPGVVSTRTMEIVTSIVLLVVSAVVIQDSLRVGAGWAENEGPRAGYFPFYIGIFLGLASLVTLVRTIMAGMQDRRAHAASGGRRQEDSNIDTAPFVTVTALRRVLLVLGPMVVFIFAVTFLGIYVPAALYITAFMMYFGKYRVTTGMAVGVVVAIALFLMFEIWFQVPLPKGPLEEMLGY
jgi:putative tricarboxylic transport membrane protein